MANSFTKLIRFEPVATLASVNVLGDSVLAGAAYASGWSGKAIVMITLIWHGVVNVIGSFFVRAASTSNANVDVHVTDKLNALSALQAEGVNLNPGGN